MLCLLWFRFPLRSGKQKSLATGRHRCRFHPECIRVKWKYYFKNWGDNEAHVCISCKSLLRQSEISGRRARMMLWKQIRQNFRRLHSGRNFPVLEYLTGEGKHPIALCGEQFGCTTSGSPHILCSRYKWFQHFA